MAKISIQDMAQAIAARHGLSQHDAEVLSPRFLMLPTPVCMRRK